MARNQGKDKRELQDQEGPPPINTLLALTFPSSQIASPTTQPGVTLNRLSKSEVLFILQHLAPYQQNKKWPVPSHKETPSIITCTHVTSTGPRFYWGPSCRWADGTLTQLTGPTQLSWHNRDSVKSQFILYLILEEIFKWVGLNSVHYARWSPCWHTFNFDCSSLIWSLSLSKWRKLSYL